MRNSIILYMRDADDNIIENMRTYVEYVNKNLFLLCREYKYVFPFQNIQKESIEVQEAVIPKSVKRKRNPRNTESDADEMK